MNRPTFLTLAAWALAACDCTAVVGTRGDGGIDAGADGGGSEMTGGGAGGGVAGGSATGGGTATGGGGGAPTGGGSAGGGSATGGGAASGGGGGAATGGGSAGGGSVDPATCPIGVADSCCPLLVHGGTDPDCASLACTQLVASQVIDLHDDDGGLSWGSNAMAWNGRELMLVRPGGRNLNPNLDSELVIERRAVDGGLIATARHPAPVAAFPGAASLAFDPVSRTYLFVHSSGQGAGVVALDELGTPLWNGTGLGICNGIDAIFQVEAARGRFYLTGTNYTCAGSTGAPIITAYDADGGAKLFHHWLGEGGRPLNSWHSSAACDLECRHAFFQWYPSWEGYLHGRMVDTATAATATPDAGFSMGINASYGGIDHTAMASNGTEYFSMAAITLSATGASTLQFQRHDGAHWLGSPVTLSGQRALPPSAIWTGSGWLIAASTFVLSTGYAFATDHRDYSIELYHFAPDGTLRERRTFETRAYGARLAWVGGRIAMTFTRVAASGTGDETQHLVFFDCP